MENKRPVKKRRRIHRGRACGCLILVLIFVFIICGISGCAKKLKAGKYSKTMLRFNIGFIFITSILSISGVLLLLSTNNDFIKYKKSLNKYILVLLFMQLWALLATIVNNNYNLLILDKNQYICFLLIKKL